MNEHQIRTLTKNIISQIRLNKIIWRQALKTHEKAEIGEIPWNLWYRSNGQW